MTTATMTSKGQITVPADVRARFHLTAGTKIDFAAGQAGEIVMRPKTGDIRELRGIVKHDGPPVSIEDMNIGIGKAVAARLKR
ncbi:MAG: AbrB/MazE/SpoVT family DNA-binding domain-containing protein [Pseudomonadota bacterium]|nr:AbrB/MazE/SpoVT family DNA-binding domain-containing protein [Pseudomonadota bacterium]